MNARIPGPFHYLSFSRFKVRGSRFEVRGCGPIPCAFADRPLQVRADPTAGSAWPKGQTASKATPHFLAHPAGCEPPIPVEPSHACRFASVSYTHLTLPTKRI